MPRLIPSRLRAPQRRSSSARRRGIYFSLPKRRNGGGGGIVSGALNLGENTNLHRATSLFLMLFMGIALYARLLIPGINDLECGVDWDSEFQVWYNGSSSDPGSGASYRTAFESWQDATEGEVQGFSEDGLGRDRVYTNPAQTAPPRIERYITATAGFNYPACDGGAFPTEPRVLGQTLRILAPFLPLFVLIPILFLFFRQVGSIAALPAFLAAILLREVIPGDGFLDWIVIMAGLVIASVPTPVKGLLSALSHICALALWPTMMLAYHGTAMGVGGDVSASVLTVLDFLVWILPFGILMLVPIRWKMRDNEALV